MRKHAIVVEARRYDVTGFGHAVHNTRMWDSSACKTSDKLSRRVFPQGYTESLEERVRSLEVEVREMKDLLDEKDKKIDMLSKMHSNSDRQRHSRFLLHYQRKKKPYRLLPKRTLFESRPRRCRLDPRTPIHTSWELPAEELLSVLCDEE